MEAKKEFKIALAIAPKKKKKNTKYLRNTSMKYWHNLYPQKYETMLREIKYLISRSSTFLG